MIFDPLPEEADAIKELCELTDLKPEQILRQGLRLYQAVIKGGMRVEEVNPLPKTIPVFQIPKAELTDGKISVVKLLCNMGWMFSHNEARRAIDGAGVTVNTPFNYTINCSDATILVEDGMIIRLGQRRVAKLVIGD